MSKRVFLFSEEGQIESTCVENAIAKPTIWICSRGQGTTVALNLSRADRAKLRAALDMADAIADKT